MSRLELVPDARAEELAYDADGVTVAVEVVDGILKVRVQDGPDGEPVMFDVHSVAPMLLAHITRDEMHAAHRQERHSECAMWDMIDYLLSRLFPERQAI